MVPSTYRGPGEPQYVLDVSPTDSRLWWVVPYEVGAFYPYQYSRSYFTDAPPCEIVGAVHSDGDSACREALFRSRERYQGVGFTLEEIDPPLAADAVRTWESAAVAIVLRNNGLR